jgi:cobalt-zinc-cadmium efflux system outer membrane protein
MIAMRRDRAGFGWIVALGITMLGGSLTQAQTPPAPGETEPLPPVLSLDASVRWALQYNPELAALRQQHGIAAAAVVIAETYPFNPVVESKVRAANGPISAGITNRVSNEHKVLMDVEVFGQKRIRKQQASALLTRTDWEIAFQEMTLGVRVARAFDTVLYRQEKLRILGETIRSLDEAVEHIGKMATQGQLRTVDLILARSEVVDTRSQLGTARTALAIALADLRRSLGTVQETIDLQGTLEIPVEKWDAQGLTTMALERRPDLHARIAAVQEAEAALRLQIANRLGNPNVGPAYEYDPTRINLIGVQVTLPLPVFNQHRGDILQREAEVTRASLDLHQTEVFIRQDVQAALTRLKPAEEAVENYRRQVLPNLREALDQVERLFAQGDKSVDLIRVLDLRRKLLRAREGYLDVLFEMNQALADLAAASADLSPVLGAVPLHMPEQGAMPGSGPFRQGANP